MNPSTQLLKSSKILAYATLGMSMEPVNANGMTAMNFGLSMKLRILFIRFDFGVFLFIFLLAFLQGWKALNAQIKTNCVFLSRLVPEDELIGFSHVDDR